MSRPAGQQKEVRLLPAQAALFKVARVLSTCDGPHQFYTLTRVQSVAAALDVDRELVPWVLAALVTRADFEAFHALREVPGTYLQLRTLLSTPAPRIFDADTSDAEFEEQLSSLLDWLDLASDFEGLGWSTP